MDNNNNNNKKEAPPVVDTYVTPLVICAVGILVTVLMLASFFFIFWWHYLRPHQNPQHTDTRSHIKGSGGLREEILNKIPIVTYSSQDSEGQSECSICLGELKDGEVLRKLPPCRHAFHVPCIDAWFKEHTNCPVCRSPITCHCESLEATNSSENGEQQWVLHVIPSDDDHHQLMMDDGVLSASNSNSRFQQHHVLHRHSHSVSICHMKKKPRSLGMRLKRSLSMDQSSLYLAITIQRDQEEASTSSSSSYSKGVNMSRYKSRSLRHLDHMSRVLMRSFSQFRNSGIGRSNGILPN